MDNFEKLETRLKECNNPYYSDILHNSKFLDLNDTFTFHCIQCGKCCKCNTAIMISPYDIYRISRYLNLSPKEMIIKHCEHSIGESSKLPILTLKVRSYDKSCTFLRDGKCKVHAVKPTVCSLYPLGRVMQETGVHYILQDVHCGSHEEIHTVTEWLDRFSNIEQEKYSKLFRTFIFDLENKCKYQRLYKVITKIDKEILDYIHQTFTILMYFSYDITLDFETQFNANATNFSDFLNDIWHFLKSGK